jgi:anti-sigma regulatory factor (Ser/Thr protein kinase)
MRYASAGHPPPIVAAPGVRAHSLQYGGPPLGVETAHALQNRDVALQREAVILFYTDGVTEFKRDIEGTEQTLRDAVARLVGDRQNAQPAAAVQRAVMGSEKPADDAVFMVLQLAPAPVVAQIGDGEVHKTWAFHSSDAYAARELRHELMRFIRGFVSADEELFRIELIIGEILANTVEHAPGLVKVEIDRSGDQPTVTIVDTGPGLGRFSPALPESDLTETGRGLFLIGTLAGGVRVESTPNQGTKMTMILSVSRDEVASP